MFIINTFSSLFEYQYDFYCTCFRFNTDCCKSFLSSSFLRFQLSLFFMSLTLNSAAPRRRPKGGLARVLQYHTTLPWSFSHKKYIFIYVQYFKDDIPLCKTRVKGVVCCNLLLTLPLLSLKLYRQFHLPHRRQTTAWPCGVKRKSEIAGNSNLPFVFLLIVFFKVPIDQRRLAFAPALAAQDKTCAMRGHNDSDHFAVRFHNSIDY
jgi:hypothetical protein